MNPAPVLIRVDTNTGHGGGKPTDKQIDEAADRLAFLRRRTPSTCGAVSCQRESPTARTWSRCVPPTCSARPTAADGSFAWSIPVRPRLLLAGAVVAAPTGVVVKAPTGVEGQSPVAARKLRIQATNASR